MVPHPHLVPMEPLADLDLPTRSQPLLTGAIQCCQSVLSSLQVNRVEDRVAIILMHLLAAMLIFCISVIYGEKDFIDPHELCPDETRFWFTVHRPTN